jgi:hypothetical protein
MFPPGLPGLALLLLRISVASAVLIEGFCLRSSSPGWLQAIAVLISAALVPGYLTPLIAVAALIFHTWIWYSHGLGSAAIAAIGSLDALALALLGPGGYSVDSILYGRRLVVLPPP